MANKFEKNTVPKYTTIQNSKKNPGILGIENGRLLNGVWIGGHQIK